MWLSEGKGQQPGLQDHLWQCTKKREKILGTRPAPAQADSVTQALFCAVLRCLQCWSVRVRNISHQGDSQKRFTKAVEFLQDCLDVAREK